MGLASPTVAAAIDRPAWAIAADPRAIEAAEAAGVLQPAPRGWGASLASGEAVVFERLYAGAEFCRHLMPSRTQLGAVLELARERGVPVTLQSPPITEEDLSPLAGLLDQIAGLPQAEIVANDWGTLRLARSRFPAVRPVLGRCLRRHKKDPRVEGLPHPGALAREVLDLLADWGVDLAEADCVPDEVSPLRLALHVPFAFVASGSLCLLSGLNRPVAEKFRPDQPCPAPCRGLHVRLSHRACRTSVLLHENTLFAPNDALAAATRGRPDVARIVYDLDTDAERTLLTSKPGGQP